MARLMEYQAKGLLERMGIPIPIGILCTSPEEARDAATEIGKPVVVKAQLMVNGRQAMGAVRFAEKPSDAETQAQELFNMKVSGIDPTGHVSEVYVEERLEKAQPENGVGPELFAGIIIEDIRKSPVLIFSTMGGSGIEEIAREHPDKVIDYPINFRDGLRDYEARNLLRSLGIHGKMQVKLGDLLSKLYQVAVRYDARYVEINPFIITTGGEIVAADCHMAIDDYAVYRHPELGIDVAREFNHHPPTLLETVAYNAEANDHRGTFYFFQMASNFKRGDGYVGFHGAGGGGSMMSMDAVLSQGFKIANYTDCSGNPPASKVYRAAKIILQQPNLDGYYASGSGVASQEQFHSARGMVKAFRELKLSVPAVIRLGGNQEEKAMEILGKYCADLPAKLEAYGKDDSAVYCAERLRAMVDEGDIKEDVEVDAISNPDPPGTPYSFESITGLLTFDHTKCLKCEEKPCIKACLEEILMEKDGVPVLNIPEEDAKKGKCTECLACEIECWDSALNAINIELPIEGLQD